MFYHLTTFIFKSNKNEAVDLIAFGIQAFEGKGDAFSQGNT
jgi:hypothetical protein